jgi:hypothetical protein
MSAIAVYLKSLSSGHASQPGATICTGTCVNGHRFDGKASVPYTAVLAGHPVALDNDPSSLINLVPNDSNRWSSKGLRTRIECRNFGSSAPIRRSPTSSLSCVMAGGNRAPAVVAAEVAKLRKASDPATVKSSSRKCVKGRDDPTGKQGVSPPSSVGARAHARAHPSRSVTQSAAIPLSKPSFSMSIFRVRKVQIGEVRLRASRPRSRRMHEITVS